MIGLPFLVAGACDFVGSFMAWLIFKFSPEMNGTAASSGIADGYGYRFRFDVSYAMI